MLTAIIIAWLLLGVISTAICVSAAIVAARYDEAVEEGRARG